MALPANLYFTYKNIYIYLLYVYILLKTNVLYIKNLNKFERPCCVMLWIIFLMWMLAMSRLCKLNVTKRKSLEGAELSTLVFNVGKLLSLKDWLVLSEEQGGVMRS